MISVANRIFVNPDYAEAFEARFADRARKVDTMPGFLFNQVLRPSGEGQPYIVLTYWESLTRTSRRGPARRRFGRGTPRAARCPVKRFPGATCWRFTKLFKIRVTRTWRSKRR